MSFTQNHEHDSCHFHAGFNAGQQEAEMRHEWVKSVLDDHLKRKGKYLFCLCPFHEEMTPSCVYDAYEDEFNCLSCGEKGNGLKLAQQLATEED
jgi:hypothetical protein